MMDRLQKDMCHLQKHTKKNRDADVQEKVKSLPGDLVYAGHLAKSKRDESLLALLTEFVFEHLVHWVKVLCPWLPVRGS